MAHPHRRRLLPDAALPGRSDEGRLARQGRAGRRAGQLPAGPGRRGFRRLVLPRQDGRFFVQAGKTGFLEHRGRRARHRQGPRRPPAGDHRRRRRRGRKDPRRAASSVRRHQADGRQEEDGRIQRQLRPGLFRRRRDSVQEAGRSPGPRRGRLGRPEPVPRLGRSRQDAVDQRGRHAGTDVRRRRHGRLPARHRPARPTRTATRPSAAICASRSATSRASRPP